MAHLKRHKVPKNWPIPRKGTAFVVKPTSDLRKGIPILVLLRDVLKIAQTRKEVKQAIHKKYLLLNNKPVKDERNSATLFDTLTIVPAKKSYRIELSEKGKFDVKEIKETEANKKVSKIVDKKVLKGKKTQLNLSDGRNFLTDVKCNVNDSVLINFKDKKIEKCLPLKEKTNVFIFAGKHAGKKGEISKLMLERKMSSIKSGDDKINALIKQIMVIE